MSEFMMSDPVRMHGQGRPQQPACTDMATGQHWSWKEWDNRIQQAMTVLVDDHGIRAGDRVAFVARNSADLLTLLLALERMAAVGVPLNHRLSPAEIGQILADCTPRLVITDIARPLACGADAGWTERPMEVLREAMDRAAPARNRPMPPGETLAMLVYTSGTSGRPKGVEITRNNIYANAMNFAVLGETSSSSVSLCDAPMFHVIGLIPCLRSPMLFGGQVIISHLFDPARTNDWLSDPALGVTHYFCVPQMAIQLRRQDNFEPDRWRTLKGLFTGGAPCPAEDIRWWLTRGIMMSNGVGMTETGTIMHVPLDPERIWTQAGSAGLPGPLMSVAIVDTRGEALPDGEIGEILVRGPGVTRAYWKQPEVTAAAFTPEGWFRTGDIGYRNEEGFITLSGRIKEMYISGGENVFPAEVEAVLLAHESVQDAAVVGMPDERWGETGHAHIILHAGVDMQESEPALRSHCQAHLARYKVPSRFSFTRSLPRTASGKLLRYQLREEDDAEDTPRDDD
ncbi:AMP-binding protein [Larsenimonas rhizosphaerae]|uniref:AMP-binding protein n=1 Tax=Larsenimonas rhizosphaerae TaxID=2944682 RepID=A0AA41ZGB3_9GAMM|nr:AMP-binding protein [Larsenimonas rhizosphaerae]MCM2131940.1 AMP-binding protein [Larsenimonas rhizosphaerae]MCX2524754.1 AMP-binding protein [Larsenimonas rhizosphaerae]